MRKILLIFVVFSLICPTCSNFNLVQAEEKNPKLAIVIDDFGEDRRGVEEMLGLPIPLTIAVMPGMEFSESDAKKASELGHEVILHMPMENLSYTPENYYGPVMIKNSHTSTEATQIISDAIDSIPNCKGVNIHMGTGVSRNEELITAIMEEVKSRDLFFLDSKTIEGSVCPKMAEKTGVKFYERDIFLEPPGRPNKQTAIYELEKAIAVAKEKGFAVAIGHVGPVGTTETASAIAEMLEKIKDSGVEVVPISKI